MKNNKNINIKRNMKKNKNKNKNRVQNRNKNDRNIISLKNNFIYSLLSTFLFEYLNNS